MRPCTDPRCMPRRRSADRSWSKLFGARAAARPIRPGSWGTAQGIGTACSCKRAAKRERRTSTAGRGPCSLGRWRLAHRIACWRNPLGSCRWGRNIRRSSVHTPGRRRATYILRIRIGYPWSCNWCTVGHWSRNGERRNRRGSCRVRRSIPRNWPGRRSGPHRSSQRIVDWCKVHSIGGNFGNWCRSCRRRAQSLPAGKRRRCRSSRSGTTARCTLPRRRR